MSLKVTFDSSARDFILETFGKTVRDGFVVEKGDPDHRVLTPRGEEVPLREFAGVRKGSIVIVKSDIVSLVEAAKAIGS